MRTDWRHLETFRRYDPPYVSREGDTFGCFQATRNGVFLNIIATDGKDENGGERTGWEHVSVHVFDPVFKKQKTPSWEEMCFVKNLFWEEDECVVEFHVAKKDWISIHDHVLHLWRSTGAPFPTPPLICV